MTTQYKLKQTKSNATLPAAVAAPRKVADDAPFFLKRCIGLDLGDRTHHYCVISAAGEVYERGVIPNTREALTDFAKLWHGTRVVLECGAQSPWIAHHLMDVKEEMEVIVANARKVESIAKDTRKCDAHDAESLARLGRADVKLLHPITHRGLTAQKDMALLRMRDAIVRQRVGMVNCVRGLLKSTGQAVPSADPGAFAKKCRDQLPEDVLEMVNPMLLVLEACVAQVKALERKIEAVIVERYPEAARLQEVDGVGPITALAFVLTIDDVQRFAHTRDVGAFLGLVPRRDQSGMRDKALPISKCGDQFLRRLLVNCAQYIMGPFGKESDLRAHGLAMVERLGEKSKKRVVVATARKLSVVLLSLLKSGASWQACRNPVTPPSPSVATAEAA